MQTAKLIYITMLVLFLVPLFGFRIKRMTEKKVGAKRRIKWVSVAVTVVLAVLISGFLYAGYRMTVNTRYELAAESYIDLHARYATGQITEDEFLKKVAPVLTKDADISGFTKAIPAEGQDAGAVRFQIGSRILPKYYTSASYSSFPKITPTGDENPIFILYLFDNASTQKYYLVEMVWEDNGGWKIAYHAPATDEQVKAAQTTLPSKINGQWFYISG
jgi:hypothetical protein